LSNKGNLLSYLLIHTPKTRLHGNATPATPASFTQLADRTMVS